MTDPLEKLAKETARCIENDMRLLGKFDERNAALLIRMALRQAAKVPDAEEIAKAIHEAKIKMCWGRKSEREPWDKPNIASPDQPWHDVARAQADAVIRLLSATPTAPSEKGGV